MLKKKIPLANTSHYIIPIINSNIKKQKIMQTHDSSNRNNQQQHQKQQNVQKKAIAQKKSKTNLEAPFGINYNWQEIANNSPQVVTQGKQQESWNKAQQNPNFLTNRNSFGSDNNANVQLKKIIEDEPKQFKTESKENKTGLPDNLKSGIENLSSYSMDDVKVHYNSDKPSQLQAHAYAQGTDIYLGAGQEKHLAHEAWHVVQQKQGRVKPTVQMKGKVNVNDDEGLETEADVMGVKALQMQTKSNSPAKTLKDTIDTSETIQGYFIKKAENGKNYKIADDRSLATGMQTDNHELYARIGKAAAANKKLKSINSGIELIETSIRPIQSLPIAKIEVANKKKASETNKDMEIYADCGRCNAVVLGSDKRTAIYNHPVSKKTSKTKGSFPSKMKTEIMIKWLNQQLLLKSTSREDKVKIGNITKSIKPINKEIKTAYAALNNAKTEKIKDSFREKYYNLYRKKADIVWSFYYDELSEKQKLKADKVLGINHYANPTVGQGYTISRGGPEFPNNDLDTWKYHWAGVIMESDDKQDKITLENYSVNDSSIENREWEIAMYGTRLKKQTFHEIHQESKQHNQYPTTMKIEPK